MTLAGLGMTASEHVNGAELGTSVTLRVLEALDGKDARLLIILAQTSESITWCHSGYQSHGRRLEKHWRKTGGGAM